jgi:glycosyltransferase involved in cell wall biosynthesis
MSSAASPKNLSGPGPEVRIAVVVPHYNHPDTLPAVVAGALEYCRLVIVVDDGSDETAAQALSKLDERALLIRRRTNLGKGAAMLSGLHQARKSGASHIITIDADGQHFTDDLP